MIIGSLELEYQASHNIVKITSNEHSLLQLLFPNNHPLLLFGSHSFYADKVSSLSDFIQSNRFSILMAAKLLGTMYTQIQHLENNGYAISYIELHDIMVIENKRTHVVGDRSSEPHSTGLTFLFSNYNKLYEVKNSRLFITDFYNRNDPILPPEFINNETIPFYCHKSSSYYSLAQIILYCFKQSIPRFSSYSFTDILNYYKDTKLYFTLKYCLNDDPDKREFVLF